MSQTVHIDSIHPGSRATQIARLIADKIPVETGFIVASHAFDSFMDHNGITSLVQELLSQQQATSPKELQGLSRQIKKKILQGEFPEDIALQISEMYLSLGEPKVMLFPSFLVETEDSPLFTEIESYFFGYEGDANLFEGIKEVWSHFFDTKPLFYRIQHGRNHFSLPFSICVQRQSSYKVTAIMYTDDPTSHTKQTTLVKAVFGEGALMRNIDGADYYWIKRGSGELYNSLYDQQYEKSVLANGREHTEKLSDSLQDKRKLHSSQLVSIAKIAKDLQQHFFFPQEVLIGCNGDHCVVIETKPFNQSFQNPSPLRRPLPATTPPSRESPPVDVTNLTLGLMHTLSQASHIPLVSRVMGHLALDPQPLLSDRIKQGNAKKKLLTHEFSHALEFIASHTQVYRGWIYQFTDLFDDPDATAAQLEAIRAIHRKSPALPITLTSKQYTFENYQRAIALWQKFGLPRSSQIAHANTIVTPAQLYRIADFTGVGMDSVLVDIDSLSAAVHGEEASQDHLRESEALLDMLQRAVLTCNELGIGAVLMSSQAPTHGMLKLIQNSSVPIEWLTTAKTYAQLAT